VCAQPFDASALSLLRTLTGNPHADFRHDQLEVIRRLVLDRERVLLVQRTGWGKSAVYFIASRMLRDRGAGPTLLVSPLLALMRNQIEAADTMGVRAASINSSNRSDWHAVLEQLAGDAVDVLLISPERLANEQFRTDVLPTIGRQTGLLVVDEAHCISDWGHDFRPDYRRIARVLDLLPPGAPVLCCTATANDRVVDDIVAQLGHRLAAVRGPLDRDGLRLHAIRMPRQADRIAWLATLIPQLPGTGIVYCLTIADTERVAGWLRSRGIEAVAYSGETEDERRIEVEQSLLANDVKVVVATSALGMGFDKPDLSFVIHYQSPGSPIAYYQQVGRAGRQLTESAGVLLVGVEDADIHDYFIRSAFATPEDTEQVVALLESTHTSMSRTEILAEVNVRPTKLDALLKQLEVDGAVERADGRWLRTLSPWSFDRGRVESVSALRKREQAQMSAYVDARTCRMQLLRTALDDPEAAPCGRCDVCTGTSLPVAVEPIVVAEAVRWLRSTDVGIEPRRRGADGSKIDADRMLQPGRCLARWGDGGWGTRVHRGKQVDERFDDDLVGAAAELILRRWQPSPSPTWLTFVPSHRMPDLVAGFARRLATLMGVRCEDVVVKVRDSAPQKMMQNSLQQFTNVRHAFEVRGAVSEEPVLLVDDVVDSRWTLTVVGGLLRDAGSGPVFPFALADTAGRTR
jgi:ATP-dependent DNA helicase RecQ